MREQTTACLGCPNARGPTGRAPVRYSLRGTTILQDPDTKQITEFHEGVAVGAWHPGCIRAAFLSLARLHQGIAKADELKGDAVLVGKNIEAGGDLPGGGIKL